MDYDNLETLNFLSFANYLKRDESSGTQSMLLKTTGDLLTTHEVTHDLTYIPFVDVFYESAADGILWNGTKIHTYTETSLSGYTEPHPHLYYWITDTKLTIQLYNASSASGSRQVYWLIYKDYRDA